MSSEDTRRRILETASKHFARYGFEGASLRKIAEDAGIKAASIFHHFPDGKTELFDRIFEEIADTIFARIVTRYGADTGLTPEDAIVQMAAAFWDYFDDHPDYAKLILLRASGMDRGLAAIEGHARAIVTSSRAFICEAQARGDLRTFDPDQFMLWSSAHTLTVHGAPFLSSFLYPSDPEKKLRASYVAMVRDYVRPSR